MVKMVAYVVVILGYHSTFPINTIPTSYKITPKGIHLIFLATSNSWKYYNVELSGDPWSIIE